MSDLMRKHEMTEEDIKLQFITPAIEGAGWDRQRQIRMESVSYTHLDVYKRQPGYPP